MDNNKHKHHHGRHHSHHMDESEKFKIHTLSASKRRKIIGKVLFVLLSIVAVALCYLWLGFTPTTKLYR